MGYANFGMITETTAKALHLATEYSDMVQKAVREIKKDSSDQAIAIEQINEGVNQISAVVQTNAATSEQSSALSEELSAQAVLLEEEVSKFKLHNSSYYITG